MTETQRDELLLNMSNQIKEQNGHMKEHDELLLNMSNQIKEQNKHMKEQDEHMKKHDELLLNMSNQMKKHDKLLINISKHMEEQDEHMKKHDELFEKVFSEIKEVKEEQRNLSRTVAKIEVEHGEKLQILLDVVTGQEQKNKEFEKRFEDNERILDRHSDEIYYLKLKATKRKPIL